MDYGFLIHINDFPVKEHLFYQLIQNLYRFVCNANAHDNNATRDRQRPYAQCVKTSAQDCYIYIYIDLLHLCEHFQTSTRTAAEVIGRRSSMAPIMV